MKVKHEFALSERAYHLIPILINKYINNESPNINVGYVEKDGVIQIDDYQITPCNLKDDKGYPLISVRDLLSEEILGLKDEMVIFLYTSMFDELYIKFFIHFYNSLTDNQIKSKISELVKISEPHQLLFKKYHKESFLQGVKNGTLH